jgi:IS5 family transposase
VDVESGFVLATTLTPASEHDSPYLPYLTIASCHTNDPIETVYGDKGYRARWNRMQDSSQQNRIGCFAINGTPFMAEFIPLGERQPNREFLSLNKIAEVLRLVGRACGLERIMRKDSTTAKLTEREIQRNKKIARKRYIVEQYFGLSHIHDGAYRARFTTILKNTWDAMCRQMAFNISRGSKLLAVT